MIHDFGGDPINTSFCGDSLLITANGARFGHFTSYFSYFEETATLIFDDGYRGYRVSGDRPPPPARCVGVTYNPCGDIEQQCTWYALIANPTGTISPLGTLDGVLHRSMSPQGLFYAHIGQGAGPSHRCCQQILNWIMLLLQNNKKGSWREYCIGSRQTTVPVTLIHWWHEENATKPGGPTVLRK